MVAISLAGAAGDGALDAGGGIPVGCPVHDVDGVKVGTLAGVDGDRLVVEHGFFWTDLVPFAAVGGFDGTALRLTVTKDEVRRGGWDGTAGAEDEESGNQFLGGY